MKNNENEIMDYITIQRNLKVGTGKKLIDFVAKKFTNITCKKVRVLDEVLINNDYPFATGKVSKYLVNEYGFLLCYVKNNHEINNWENKIPKDEIIKYQHLMVVKGANIAYIAVLFCNEKMIIK